MRFLRHLAAAALLVAAVALLGLAWNRFAASTLVGTVPSSPQKAVPGQRASRPPPGKIAPGARIRLRGPHGPGAIRAGPMNLGLSSMLDPVNLPDLRHTVVIEAGVVAAVVIIDAGRRKARRAPRTRSLALSPSGDDDGADQ